MTTVNRIADATWSLSYITQIEPSAPPTLYLFSDEGRTAMVGGPFTPLVVRPNEFNYSGLPPQSAGTVQLQFITTVDDQTYYDENDSVTFSPTQGDTTDGLEPLTRLRRMTGEPGPEFYTDADMQAYLTAYTDAKGVIAINRAALAIWVEKAARYASMTDIVESGSERKLSTLYKNASGMVSLYQKFVADEDVLAQSVVTGARVAGRSTAVWGGEATSTLVLHDSLGPRLWGTF